MPPGTTFTDLCNQRRSLDNCQIFDLITKLCLLRSRIQRLVPEKYMKWYLQKIQWYLNGKLSLPKSNYFDITLKQQQLTIHYQIKNMPPGTTFTNLYNWRRCPGNSRIGYFLTKLWFHPPMIQKFVLETYMEWYLQQIQWYNNW